MDANCKTHIHRILREQGDRRKNGKVASERTKTLTREVVSAVFKQLHTLGYKLQNPVNLQERHIRALVEYWWFTKKRSPKGIQNDLSRLRRFAEMMGKPGLVRSASHYLPDVDPQELKVQTVTRRGKSVSAQNVDVGDILARADQKDWRLGLMLRMQLAFGLRREEVLKCDPYVQDMGDWLAVPPGHGKGGRPRNIPILTRTQRDILDMVKAGIPKGEKLGWPYMTDGKPATLKQNLVRYRNLMSRTGFTKNELGTTGHGLRAQFAENNALLHGILPPTLGGSKNQVEKDEMKIRLRKLAEAMGHSREQVMGAYYGSFTRKNALHTVDGARQAILDAVSELDAAATPFPSERLADCQKIQMELQLLDLDLTLRQVHSLWLRWALRNGQPWIRPDGEILLCLVAVSARPHAIREEAE